MSPLEKERPEPRGWKRFLFERGEKKPPRCGENLRQCQFDDTALDATDTVSVSARLDS
jgi:hypothetical protein